MKLCRIFPILCISAFLASCGEAKSGMPVIPADPTGLAVEQLTSSSARLSWTAAGDADTYYVFARPEHEAYYVTPAATLPAGSSSYEFTGLTPGASYYLGVQAVGIDNGYRRNRYLSRPRL